MKKMSIKRGTIVLCELPVYENSHIQGSRRPAVVVSNDLANASSPVLHVVPLTTSMKKKLPVHSLVESALLPSTALAEQLTVIDKNQVIRVYGTLLEREMSDLTQAIRIQLAI